MPKKLHNALTPVTVRNAGSGRLADGGGLYLFVKPSGSRSWVYRATVAGKVRDIGLGSASGAGAISLADARELARDKAREAAAGGVPVSDRRKRQREAKAAEQASRIATTTFRDVAQSFIDLNEESWRNAKHRGQWRSTLEGYAYPHFGDLPIADIGTEHITAALTPIWNEKPETASRLRGRIETILDAAKVQGLREGENPARWRGHLDKVLPRVSKAKAARNKRLGSDGHHPAMPYRDVPAFMTRLAACEGVAAMAMHFTLLTAARSGETLGAKWREIDLAEAVWNVPAERMKAGKPHRVPLSMPVVTILKRIQALNTTGDPDATLFPARHGGSLSAMAMTMQLRRMVQSATIHGFRSSFRDWAAESTGFAHEVCEMALAHAIGSDTEAAYRRGDLFEKRRRLMDEWASYCASGGAAGAKVTPIRKENRQ